MQKIKEIIVEQRRIIAEQELEIKKIMEEADAKCEPFKKIINEATEILIVKRNELYEKMLEQKITSTSEQNINFEIKKSVTKNDDKTLLYFFMQWKAGFEDNDIRFKELNEFAFKNEIKWIKSNDLSEQLKNNEEYSLQIVKKLKNNFHDGIGKKFYNFLSEAYPELFKPKLEIIAKNVTEYALEHKIDVEAFKDIKLKFDEKEK